MQQTDSHGTDSDGEEFYYGYRQEVEQNVTAQPTYVRRPLQPEDFLDPREDDHFVQGPNHDRDLNTVADILRHHYRNNQHVTVRRTHKLRWDDPSLPRPIADVAVIAHPAAVDGGTAETNADVADRLPRCIIEVTSPRLLAADLEQKPQIYAQGGVQEYIIIDSGLREEKGEESYRILGYRLTDEGYREIPPDAEGGIHSATNGIRIAPTPERDGFVVTDERTGQPIRPVVTLEGDRAAEVSGSSRARDLGSALDFLRGE